MNSAPRGGAREGRRGVRAALTAVARSSLPDARAWKPDRRAWRRGLARYERAAKVIDAHLGKHEWLAGKGLTVADLSVAASLTYAGPCEVPLAPYPTLSAWFGGIRELRAW